MGRQSTADRIGLSVSYWSNDQGRWGWEVFNHAGASLFRKEAAHKNKRAAEQAARKWIVDLYPDHETESSRPLPPRSNGFGPEPLPNASDEGLRLLAMADDAIARAELLAAEVETLRANAERFRDAAAILGTGLDLPG